MEEQVRIIVALKFIEEPDDLLNRALKVANKYNAKIYLLHVLQDMPHLSFYSDSYKYWVEFRDAAVRDTIKQMAKYIEKLSGEFEEVEPIVVVGEPVEAILNEADRIDADLIIVGNHALSGLKHFMHHNIGEKIVRLSKRPVLSFYLGETQDSKGSD